jgi:hypothetical protein
VKRAFVPSLISATVAIFVFAITLGGGFAYDFYGIARNDTRLQHPAEWGTYWQQSYNGGVDNLYRPLTSTLFAVQSYLNGLDGAHAWRFHLFSLLLHAGVSALVAELARRLTNSRVAIIAGLLYALHPIHVEVVADIVGQAEMLCALGTVGAMVLFLHRPMTNGRAVAILLLFILAVLSKEQGMLLPLLLLCLAGCMRMNSWMQHDASHKNAMKLLVLLLCWSLGAYIFFRERIVKFWWDRHFLDPAINPMKLSFGMDRVLMPFVLLGRYVQLLIFPWKLAPDYSGAAIGWHVRFDDPYLYVGFASLIAWVVLCLFAVKKRAGVMLFCLLGIAITYGLIGNIVTIIGTNFAERLMYLPSVFFVILIAMMLSRLPKRPLVVVMTLIIALASVRSFTYARRWNDRLALYEQAVKDQPGAVRMYLNLAGEYLERGQVDQMRQVLQKARLVMPNYAHLWVYSAAAERTLGNYKQAEQFLDVAEEILRQDKSQPFNEVISERQHLLDETAATRPAQ